MDHFAGSGDFAAVEGNKKHLGGVDAAFAVENAAGCS